MTTHPGKFIPTGRKNPCPICGNTNGDCRTFPDSPLVLCMKSKGAVDGYEYRGESEGGSEGLWGRYVPIEGCQSSRVPVQSPTIEYIEGAKTAEQWDAEYKVFLAKATLNEADERELSLRLQAIDLEPAVYLPKLNARSLSSGAGYVVPIRNEGGLFVGSQLRLAEATEGRYRWWTPLGAKVPKQVEGQNPLAVWEPTIEREDGEGVVVLAEGTGVKPFIAAQRLGVVAIGAAGGLHASSSEHLKRTLTRYRCDEIWIAVDAGAIQTQEVLRQYKSSEDLCSGLNLPVRYLWWGQVEKLDGDIDEVSDLSRMKILKPRKFWETAKLFEGVKDDSNRLNTIVTAYAETSSPLLKQALSTRIGSIEPGLSRNRLDVLSRAIVPSQRVKLESLETISLDAYKQMEARKEGRIKPGVVTGFYDLDAMTQGFQPSDFIIIAARPSQGKTSLVQGLIRGIAGFQPDQTALFFSLEMSKEQLSNRLLSSEISVPSGKLRSGKMSDAECDRYMGALPQFMGLPIHIDDTPDLTVDQIVQASKEFAKKSDISIIAIDYLQLISGLDGDNRTIELGKVSRKLKILARDLNVPVIALSQLSRGVESRQDKRPIMADLRECLPRSAWLVLEDGRRISISDVKPGMRVASLDESQKVSVAEVDNAWSSGIKGVYKMTTRSGRSIEATENHPFLTQDGYVPLSQLDSEKHLLAVPYRNIPIPESTEFRDGLRARLLGYLIGNGCIRNSLSFVTPCDEVKEDFVWLVDELFPGANFSIENKTGNCWEIDIAYHYKGNYGKPYGNLLREWLRELGLVGCLAWNKFVPDWVFSLGMEGISEFLGGYLATDGCVTKTGDRMSIRYDTSSPQLAADTQHLLSRIGVASSVSASEKKREEHHHLMYRIALAGNASNIRRYCSIVKPHGYKSRIIEDCIESIEEKRPGGDMFSLPKSVSSLLAAKSSSLKRQGVKNEGGRRGWRDQGKKLNRSVCAEYADKLDDDELRVWAESDLIWDEIRTIEHLGEQEVFDVSVSSAGNFIANEICVHNCGSFEQDADLILMLYRDEYYNPDSQDQGVAEIIIRKHRNGPIGTVKLLFEPEYTRFRNLAR